MYKRSTKIELALTLFVTIPAAGICTFVLDYSLVGIVASCYVGYGLMGFLNIVLFANADWDRAVMKNKKMSGVAAAAGGNYTEEKEDDEDKKKEMLDQTYLMDDSYDEGEDEAGLAQIHEGQLQLDDLFEDAEGLELPELPELL